MVQEKVGQTDGCCQVAQSPARGSGFVPVRSHPSGCFYTERGKCNNQEAANKAESGDGGKAGSSTKFSGRKEERTQQQAHVLPRRGGFQGDGKGNRMSDCSRRHREGF